MLWSTGDPHQLQSARPWPDGRHNILRIHTAKLNPGLHPCLDTLVPADVVLTTASASLGRFVRSVQAHGCRMDPAHAEFVHAALYIGDGNVVHATPPQVAVQEIARVVGGAPFLVLRAEEAAPEQCREIAEYALKLRSGNYSRRDALLAGLEGMLASRGVHGSAGQSTALQQETFICSTLIAHSYFKVMAERAPMARLPPPAKRRLLPADYIGMPGFARVPPQWWYV